MEFRAFAEEPLESFIDEKGYVRVYVGEGVHPHANKGYVAAHRLAIEAHLRRFIEPHEVVHHINEVKTDNRLQNLYLCTAEEHVAIHNRGRQNSLAAKAKIRQGVLEANRRKNQKTGRG